MGWTVWGLNPSGNKTFHTRPNLPWGIPSLLYRGYHGVALIIYPHSVPILKKEQSYTSTFLWAFIACSRMNFTFSLQKFSLPSVKLRALFSLIFSQLGCLVLLNPILIIW